MQLNYNVSKNGKTLGVYDQKTYGGIIEYYVGPFDTVDECRQYCKEYSDAWEMGYNGRAKATIIEDKHYASCSRWSSCD